MSRGVRIGVVAAAAIATFSVTASASPIAVVSTDASALAAALGVTGVNSAILAGTGQAGTFTDADGSPIFFSSGLFLTSGGAACFTAGDPAGDCTGGVGGALSSTLTINFTPSADATTVGFKFIFGSEEFFNFVGTGFQDTFQFLVNGVNFAKLTNGDPVTIDNAWLSDDYIANHADATRLSVTHGTATPDSRSELDGFTTVLQFVAPVNPGVPNVLVLTITDVGDTVLDSAVLIEAGSFEENPETPSVPEPATLLLFGIGALTAGSRMKRRVA